MPTDPGALVGIPAPGHLKAPAGDEIQVWWARARFGELDEDLRRDLALDLNEATLTRLARFRREQDRDRGLAAHSLMRRVLAGVSGGRPSELVLRTRCAGCGATDHGKPYLDTSASAGVEMNLSHSGDVVCVALAAPGVSIGIDAEQRRTVDWVALRRSVFADPEWAATEAATEPDRRRTDFWSRKESAVKASGHGLSLPLRSVIVEDADWGGWTATLPDDAGSAMGWDLALAPDVAAAVSRHHATENGPERPASDPDPRRPPPRPTVYRADLAAVAG